MARARAGGSRAQNAPMTVGPLNWVVSAGPGPVREPIDFRRSDDGRRALHAHVVLEFTGGGNGRRMRKSEKKNNVCTFFFY